jgi:hypothetical protein
VLLFESIFRIQKVVAFTMTKAAARFTFVGQRSGIGYGCCSAWMGSQAGGACAVYKKSIRMALSRICGAGAICNVGGDIRRETPTRCERRNIGYMNSCFHAATRLVTATVLALAQSRQLECTQIIEDHLDMKS